MFELLSIMGKSKLKAVLTLLLLAVTNWRVEAFVSRPVSASVTSRLPGGTSSSPFPPKHPSSLNPLKLSDDASKEDGKPKVYVDPLVKEASLLGNVRSCCALFSDTFASEPLSDKARAEDSDRNILIAC